MTGSVYDWPRYYESATPFADGTRSVYRWESDHTPPSRRSDFSGWARSTYNHETFARDVDAGRMQRITDADRLAELVPKPIEPLRPINPRPEPPESPAAPPTEATPESGRQTVMNWHPRPRMEKP